MSVDRTKVLEAAQKHLAKGNYDKAIGEFAKIVQADPTDVRTWLKIGDLYTRKGARREAIETYAKVAWQYGEQGFFLKAVAVYKQILKLDPTRLDIQLKLAEMYEMLQLTSDALATYEHVAAGYARAGNIDKALATLVKMTDLDPENIPVRIKLAEALSKAGKTKEAADAFQIGATLLKENGRMDDYIKVAERLLFHRPEDVLLARELALLYLEREDPKRALNKLQLCFKADAKDISTLELLAEAFNQLGQLPKTISVYREIARVHQEANRVDDRVRTLRKIVELDPGDAEARQGLAAYAKGSSAAVRKDIAPPASAVVEPSRSAVRETEPPEIEEMEFDEEEALAEDDEEEEIIIVEEEEPEEEQAAAAPPTREAPRSVPPDVAREAQIARLLTECDVFMRYGLRKKVVEQLHQVLEIEPLHVEARERLKDIHLAQGQTEEAIAELITLADILAEEKSAAAVLYLKEILDLDPNHEDAKLRLQKLGDENEQVGETIDELAPPMEATSGDDVYFLDETNEDETTSTAIASQEAPAVEEVEDAELLEDAEELGTGDILVSEPEPSRPVPPPEPRRALVPPPSRELPIPPPSRELPIPPPPPSARIPPPARRVDPLAPMSPKEFDEVPLRPSVAVPAKPDSVRMSISPGEVEEILDEVDFYIAQGLLDEARGTLKDAIKSHPKNTLLVDRMRDLEQLEEAGGGASDRTVLSAAPDDQSFELAEKLAEELDDIGPTSSSPGSDVLDVEAVFEQFKKGVEQQVAMEDTETHFDLGIAYKEMGLLDDAMNEFRLCLVNPHRICIAQTMIGLCQIEKGDLKEAISHFKKGLYAETKTDREELGLYFELGHAYELLHDPKEALYYYQKVQKRDPTFRDVGGRIQNLAKPQAAPEANPPSMQSDDIDRAFDDLMGED